MKIEKCPFCCKEVAEISNCQELEGCRHFEKCPATEPYVCVVCNMHEGGCGASSGYYDSAEKAIAAWNRRSQPENKPLTQDELKQMEGEPVWIVTLDGTDEPRWEIVVSAGKCGVDLICVLNGVETRDYADFDLYNDTWLAYRSKPERSEGEWKNAKPAIS